MRTCHTACKCICTAHHQVSHHSSGKYRLSHISWPLILIGLLIPRVDYLITLGIILFSLVVVLQFVTLPVEFNASRRAMAILEGSGYLYPDELKGARSVLTAAAMTYVAAMVSASLQLLRLVLLFGNRRR